MKPFYNILHFFNTLLFHRRIIRLLNEELAKPFELRLREMHTRMGGGMEIRADSPMVSVISALLIDVIKNTDGADNFLCMNYFDKDTMQGYKIMIQRKLGKEPSEIVMELKAEIVALKAKLAEYELLQTPV